jgi:hypothetical protein
MKKQNYLFCSLVLVLFFASCHKEAIRKNRIIKDISENNEFHYTYDGQNRISKLQIFATVTDDKLSATETYDYSQTNKVIKTAEYNSIITKTIIELDDKGRAIKVYPEDASQKTIYAYNSDSQISNITYVSTSSDRQSIVVSLFSNGNETESTHTIKEANGNIIYQVKSVNEYSPTILNSLDNEHYGTMFYGKSNKNAFSKRTTTLFSVTNGVVYNQTDVYDYSYELDTDGNIVKMKEVHTVSNNSSGGPTILPIITNHTYFHE